jgi:iron complex outermembrane receptor protein
MNRCYRPALLTAALCAALPLYASDAAPDAPDRSPTELAAVRVQARQPVADTVQTTSFGSGDWKDTRPR